MQVAVYSREVMKSDSVAAPSNGGSGDQGLQDLVKSSNDGSKQPGYQMLVEFTALRSTL
jgi:hypothetical protein